MATLVYIGPAALAPNDEGERFYQYMLPHFDRLHDEKQAALAKDFYCQPKVVIPARLFDEGVATKAFVFGMPCVEEEATTEGQVPFVRCRCEP
jgi:hypothetical protein